MPTKRTSKRVVTVRTSAVIVPSASDLITYGNAIVAPDETDIASYGTPAYIASDFSDGGLTYRPVDHVRVSDLLSDETHAIPLADMLASLAAPVNPTTGFTIEPAPEPELHTGILAPSSTFDGATSDGRVIIDTTSDQAQTSAPTPTTTDSSETDKQLAKRAAATAVSRFYGGPGKSLPFKSAYELPRKAPINFHLQRSPSARTAGLIAAILTYCDVQPGTLQFVRGSGAVPGRLLGLTGTDADRTLPAGPESGCLSNCLGNQITYVAGSTAGAGAENAVFALNVQACRANLQAHNAKQADGEHIFSAPLALLDMLAQPVASTAAESDTTTTNEHVTV